MHGNEQWPISLGRQRKLALLVALGGSSRSVLSPWSQGESGLRSAGFEHRRRRCGATVATNAADKVALWALILNFCENSFTGSGITSTNAAYLYAPLLQKLSI